MYVIVLSILFGVVLDELVRCGIRRYRAKREAAIANALLAASNAIHGRNTGTRGTAGISLNSLLLPTVVRPELFHDIDANDL